MLATPPGDRPQSVSLSLADVAPEAREVLLAELAAFTDAQSSPTTRDRYAALVDAVDKGQVPEELTPSLEVFLELVLSGGRLRKEHGAEADAALTGLFFRLPTGAAARQAAGAVTRALGKLGGQVLERITVSAGLEGHTVTIETDRSQVVVELDRGGARVKSLEVTA